MLLYKSGMLNSVASADKVRTIRRCEIADYTTYGLGGAAEKMVFPKTPYQAKAVYRKIRESGSKVAVLGCGSDVLASDGGFDGTVICTRAMTGIIGASGSRIVCLAGTTVGQILAYCKRKELGGLEFLCGIPATIGGIAFMNAGAGGSRISDNLVNVRIYSEKEVVLNNKQCNFGYRRSTMRDINALILSVTLQLEPSDKQIIEQRIDRIKDRRAHLPKGRSCGCVFKNGEGYSAGELIEKAGLKGATVGGAFVSPSHANFIINRGGTSRDVRELIELIRAKVFLAFGVRLEEEVVYIGDFYDFNG